MLAATTEAKSILDGVIKTMCDSLNKLRELFEDKLTTNQISWIENDLDNVTVNYFGLAPDGDNQERINNKKKMSPADAVDLLSVRYENTMRCLEAYQNIVL